MSHRIDEIPLNLSVPSLAEDDKLGITEKYDHQKENEREEIIKTCNLIANTTPCGTNVGDPIPISPEWLKPGMTVYDLVYARETELIKAAKEKGLKASGGLGMLVMQGAMSFGLWTGEKIEEIKNIMKQAALEKLANKKA